MLYDEFNSYKHFAGAAVFKNKANERMGILKNLNPALAIREYQKEAIGRFIYYLNEFPQRVKPVHLLFHMATGSGKTLVMAANILQLYEQGYRNFLFFVNSTNIIEKTKDNFLNPNSSKYVFAEKIVFGEREVRVQMVDNFEVEDEGNINILFTTIQGLHSRLYQPRENAITFEDFSSKKIVLLSDEAHHINAYTRNDLGKDEQEAIKTWETTVQKIIKSNDDNVLLEYTATIDLDNPDIKEKYADKILYQYSLKEYREDGYSKEVRVLEADLPQFQRALQAVVLSQYRRKVAEKHNILLKPVILFKSKTIAESKQFEEEFLAGINKLRTKDLFALKKNDTEDTAIKRAFDYFIQENVRLDSLCREIGVDFAPERCLSVNSQDDSEEKQLIVNSLEDKNNAVRVIFAVDKLNEGWDVLNLFDIVRLYETRDARAGMPGRTTIAEAQLIGRGARYFPFQLGGNGEKYKRKFDGDLGNDLRIIEELYYHSAHNPKYIQELHQALIMTGIIAERAKEIEVRIKENIKKTDFWQKGLIFTNEKIRFDRSKIKGLSDVIKIIKNNRFHLGTGIIHDEGAFEEGLYRARPEEKSAIYKMIAFGDHLVRKALDRLPFYHFNNLQSYFPSLESIKEFINSPLYLHDVEVEVFGKDVALESISQADKLRIVVRVLQEISKQIEAGVMEYAGTKTFVPRKVETVAKDKSLKIVVNENTFQEFGVGMAETSNRNLHLDLGKEDWYVYHENYGTSEEKYLVKFIKKAIESLEKKYQDIYLLRNERLFQLYRFSDGQAIEPDFVLFLTEKKSGKAVSYQLFIEAKGEQLIEHDKWKEEFLLEIEKEAKIEVLFKNKEFRLIGLPFYNENEKARFMEEFESKLLSGTA